MPEQPRLHRDSCAQLQCGLQRAAGWLLLLRRLHGLHQCQLQCAEHLLHPGLVRNVRRARPPPRGGRSGSPDADVGLHGPGRRDLFGRSHVAPSVRLHVPRPGLQEHRRVQLPGVGHCGQPNCHHVVHRACHRLHVAHGDQLQQHCQHRWHVHVPRPGLHELCRQQLHAHGQRQRRLLVHVHHQRLHDPSGAELQPLGHRRQWLPVSGEGLSNPDGVELCGRRHGWVQHHVRLQRPGLQVCGGIQLQPERHG